MLLEQSRAKHVQPGQGKTFRARGDLFFFKVVGADNDDAFSMCEVWNAPQGGSPRISTTATMRRSSSWRERMTVGWGIAILRAAPVSHSSHRAVRHTLSRMSATHRRGC
jgi:hypothetical protein